MNKKTESSSTPSAEELFHRSTELATNWQFEEAVDAIEKAIEADRDNAEYHMMLGFYKGRTGNREAMLKGLEKALELDPGNPRYHNNRAVYYMREGMYKEALEDIERVFHSGHDSAIYSSKYTLALIHLQKQEYEKAIEVLDDIERTHGQATAELRYLIILETEGKEAARKFGRSVLPSLEEKSGYSPRLAIRLLLGEIDLRDVDIHHYYVLDAYEAILRHASSIVNNLAHPDQTEGTTKERPVLLIRTFQPIGIEPDMASIATRALHSGMVKDDTYRIVDDDSRKAALAEMKTSLSGLTAGETDLKLGRFLEAEYILAGSIAQVEGEYLCNIVITHTETAQILFSSFLYASDIRELTGKLVKTAVSLHL